MNTTTPANSIEAVVLCTRRKRVTMRETDASGLIFFAEAAAWSNDMLCHWLAELGRPLAKLLQESTAFPIRRTETEYFVPLALDDEVELVLRAIHVGGTSFALQVSMVRMSDEVTAIEVRTWHVHAIFRDVGIGNRPEPRAAPLPRWFQDALSG